MIVESETTDQAVGCVGEGMAVKFMAHKKVAGDLEPRRCA